MKISFSFFWILLVATAFFTSCQREVDASLLNNTASGDSSYLSKFFYIDTTLPSGSDTLTRGYFTYDNQKRLTSLKFYYSPLVNSSDDSAFYSFRYNGTDSLPSIIVEMEYGFNGPGSYNRDSSFLFYSSNIVKKDSAIFRQFPGGDPEIDVADFSISGNQVKYYQISSSYPGYPYSYYTVDSAIYLVNTSSGNITYQKSVGGGIALIDDFQVSYDTNSNPYGKIIKFRYPCIENFAFSGPDFQTNNIVHYQEADNSGTTTFDELIYYIYNSHGLPVSRTSNVERGKNIYIYSAL
jgi:hypothetical protein